MSRKCSISKQGRLRGHKVSHANNKSNKVWESNLHYRRLFDSEAGKWVRLRVSSRMLRTIDKKGLAAAMREAGLK